MICAALSQVGLISWALHHIPDICTSKAPDKFNFKSSKTNYNTATIWGAIGQQHFFGEGSTYQNLLYFLLVGAVPPFPIYYFDVNIPIRCGSMSAYRCFWAVLRSFRRRRARIIVVERLWG
ncbi:hypothetical protein AWENTII_008202 [Aspergillus wentii]|nr:hypothetical protein MW887_002513 [Aspergillus wentii]